MTKLEYEVINNGLEEIRGNMIKSFDTVINRLKGIDMYDKNLCGTHLKVDCMCDEPHD